MDEKKFGKYNNPMDLSYFDNGEFTDFTYGNGRRDVVRNRDYPNAEARKEAYWKTQNDYSSLGKDDLNTMNQIKYGLGAFVNSNNTLVGPPRDPNVIENDNRNLARDLAQSQTENQPSRQTYHDNYKNAVMNQKRDAEQKAFDAMMADRSRHYANEGADSSSNVPTETPNAMAGDPRYNAPSN